MPIKMVLVGGGGGIKIGEKLIQLAENSLQDKKQTENEHKHKILSILLCKTI